MIKRLMIIALSIVIASESFFPSVDAFDLIRIPELFAHYERHLTQSPEMSFSEFVALHYDNDNHMGSNPAEHQGLPFSKRRHPRVSLQLVSEPILIEPHGAFILLSKVEDVISLVLHPKDIAAQIWQPPRFK